MVSYYAIWDLNTNFEISDMRVFPGNLHYFSKGKDHFTCALLHKYLPKYNQNYVFLDFNISFLTVSSVESH